MSENNSQWVIVNDGQYRLSVRSAVAPDTYVQVASFAENVPYLIIDTVRFVLNKYYELADDEDGAIFKERDAQWEPYLDTLTNITEQIKKDTGRPDGGTYL